QLGRQSLGGKPGGRRELVFCPTAEVQSGARAFGSGRLRRKFMVTKRVMIAEDHKETANAISDFMKFIFPDWTLDHVATGKDAIAKTIENPADVLILDIALADEINGLEVVQKIWE